MAVNFPIDKSYLISGWLQGVLWGMYSVLFCIFALLHRQNKFKGLSLAIIAAYLMYILATFHMYLSLSRFIDAFITYRDDPGPVLFYASTTTWVSNMASYMYIINMVIADSILVWRMHLIWDRDMRVTLAGAVMVLGTAISGLTANSLVVAGTASFTTAINWGTSMFIISLSTNVIVTLMIAGRIFYQAWQMRDLSGGTVDFTRYRRVVLVVTESGTLITAAKIIEFTLYKLAPDDGLNGNNAMYIPNKCMPQITGIAPLMILIAVGTGFTGSSARRTSTSPPSAPMKFNVPMSTLGSTRNDIGIPTHDRSMTSGSETEPDRLAERKQSEVTL